MVPRPIRVIKEVLASISLFSAGLNLSILIEEAVVLTIK